MSKESNVKIFNDWLDSEGICDLMSYEALEFKKLLKSKVETLIASEVKKAERRGSTVAARYFDKESEWSKLSSGIDSLIALTQEKNK